MANPIPPLFCSTPPPMDDDTIESINDDDFGDFTNAYQEAISDYMDNGADDEFNDFHSGVPTYFEANKESKNDPMPREIFPMSNIPGKNLICDKTYSAHSEISESENQLKHHKKTSSLSSLSEQQTSSIISNSVETESLQNIENKLNDEFDEKNAGDLQYEKSTESNQSDSKVEEKTSENDETQTSSTILSNNIIVEDIIDDDSDDECHSPRNWNNFSNCDENSNEFFALEPLSETKWDGTESIEQPKMETESMDIIKNIKNVDNSDALQAADFSLEKAEVSPHHSDKKEDNIMLHDASPNFNENDDFDEFANFQDFSTTNNEQSDWQASFEETTMYTTNHESETATNKNVPQTAASDVKTIETKVNEIDAVHTSDGDAGDDDDDDDDDFGDFSVAPTTTQPTLLSTPVTPTAPIVVENISSQLKSILGLMFQDTESKEQDSTNAGKINSLKEVSSTKNTLELAFVESAKALDYQWNGSNVRHALIRSLGIDSRNIFLTEKWNPSMPRFAANLSFDPLQPLKPTSASSQSETTANAASSTKTVVPVAEFDWKSSGLVNPLDASHVHTLLLDVDQLVVVANLDNINLDSSSSCSQSSPKRTSMANSTTTNGFILNNAIETTSTSTTVFNLTTTSTTTTTTMSPSSSIMKHNVNNGVNDGTWMNVNNTFHGDNPQMNNTEFTAFHTFNSNAYGTNSLCDSNNIIDLHDTGNILMPTNISIQNIHLNNCKKTHLHHHNNKNNNNQNNYNNNNNNIKNIFNNNNNNACTSHDAFMVNDTICFDASITANAYNLLLPNTSVAFTNHLKFNNLHHSMPMASPTISSNPTPTTTTSTSTTKITKTEIITKPKTVTETDTETDFTNIGHHFEQMKMSTVSTTSFECIKTNSYRESRPKEEVATQSTDASHTESGAPDNGNGNNANENDCDTSSASSSSYASTEAPATAAPTTGATLSSFIAGSSSIDAGVENDLRQDNDIGFYDAVSSNGSNHTNSETPKHEFKELEILGESNAFSEQQQQHNQVPLEALGGEIIIEKTITTETRDFNEVIEENFQSGSIARSTFAGPLKETHIFTPSKSEQEGLRTTSALNSTKVYPIDFDYEKAAAGIIIDETVVRKEYRDVEYNPGFSLGETCTQPTGSPTLKSLDTLSGSMSTANTFNDFNDDEFTDFQSVAPPENQMSTITPQYEKPKSVSTTTTSTTAMILSPAILLPQAISIESKQPKIEWGDSAANIDPDELARIEEIFSHDRNSCNNSKKSTPIHNVAKSNSLSISASIAKQSHSQHNNAEDDDWSDFVSVPIPATNRNNLNVNTSTNPKSPQRILQSKKNMNTAVNNTNTNTNTNDDEWSDFVSVAPCANATTAATHLRQAPQTVTPYGLPQFNSASWQNANFYNNPLSIYHRGQANFVPNSTPTKLLNNNTTNHNNNNNQSNNNFYQSQPQTQSQYLSNYQAQHLHPQQLHQQQQQHQQQSQLQLQQQQQQQIQIMQDFSTSTSIAAATPYRPNVPQNQSHYPASMTAPFQVGSAKVAPTVSLIPDLGFIAPAMPVHTAVINALPKPTSAGKK